MAQKHLFAALLIAVAVPALAKDYTYRELDMKDYSEIQKMTHKILGRGTLDDVEREPKVRAALKLVLARRNNDGKRTALFMNLQSQLPEPFFILSLQKLAEGAIAVMKDEKQSHTVRATAFVILENTLAEIQPRSQDFKGVLEIIRDAGIQVDDGLRSFRRLEGMDTNQSPSEIARNILDRADQRAKEDNKDGLIANSPAPDFD